MGASLAEIVILADDLSGAAETASTLAAGVPGGVEVLLVHASGGSIAPAPGPVALDLNTRSASPDDAFRGMTDTLSLLPAGRLLLKKVDSLLRGNYAAEVAAIAASGRTVLFAPALPRLNRVVRGGRPWVDGAALAQTASWRQESTAPPESLVDALPDAVLVPLDAVRDGLRLHGALGAAEPGTVLVCDAETENDLERIAHAALGGRRDGEVALAGSSALAGALGRLLGAPTESDLPPGTVSVEGRAAFVVGTSEPRAQAQVGRLRECGAHVLTLDPRILLEEQIADETVSAARAAMAARVSVLTLDGRVPVDPGARRLLSARLAGLAASAASSSPPALLTLTGGETARAVLDALRVERITVHGTVNGGSALSTAGAGTTFVTRPGSFGEDDDFLRILERVSPSGYSALRT